MLVRWRTLPPVVCEVPMIINSRSRNGVTSFAYGAGFGVRLRQRSTYWVRSSWAAVLQTWFLSWSYWVCHWFWSVMSPMMARARMVAQMMAVMGTAFVLTAVSGVRRLG